MTRLTECAPPCVSLSQGKKNYLTMRLLCGILYLMRLTRDERDMLQLSGWFALCLFPIFGAVVVVAITIEAIVKAFCA